MEKLAFKPYVCVFLHEGKKKAFLERPFKDNRHLQAFEMNDVGIFIIKNLSHPIYEDVLMKKINEKFPDGLEEAKEILLFLKDELYIDWYDESLEDQITTQYNRIFPIWGEFETATKSRFDIYEDIKRKKVGIIGCGTIGTGVAVKLAMCGVSHFVLMDDDKVEIHNLSRQPLFSYPQIGREKVMVCKELIENRHPNPKIEAFDTKLTSEEDLLPFKDCDLLVLCGDYPSFNSLSEIVENFAYKYNLPVHYAGGYNGNQGKLHPIVIPDKTHCFSCWRAEVQRTIIECELGVQVAIETSRVSGTVQLSEILSSMISFECLKYLTETEQELFVNKVGVYSMKTYSILEVPYEPQPDCPRCSHLGHPKTNPAS